MFNLMDKTMWTYVIKDVIVQLKYTPYAIFLGILVYSIVRMVSPQKDKENHHVIKALFFMYLFALVHVTLLEREPGSRTGISVILFETFGGSRNNAYEIENILLFIPFGLLTAGFIRSMENIFISLAAGAFCSLAIETTQLITQRGFFQVDDIFTNTIGMVIGCCCCRLFRLLHKMIRYNRKAE